MSDRDWSVSSQAMIETYIEIRMAKTGQCYPVPKKAYNSNTLKIITGILYTNRAEHSQNYTCGWIAGWVSMVLHSHVMLGIFQNLNTHFHHPKTKVLTFLIHFNAYWHVHTVLGLCHDYAISCSFGRDEMLT